MMVLEAALCNHRPTANEASVCRVTFKAPQRRCLTAYDLVRSASDPLDHQSRLKDNGSKHESGEAELSSFGTLRWKHMTLAEVEQSFPALYFWLRRCLRSACNAASVLWLAEGRHKSDSVVDQRDCLPPFSGFD